MVNANTELVHVLYTVLFLGVLFLGGQAAQAFTFPSLLGELAVGAICGPHVLNFVPDAEGLALLGQLGLYLLVIEAGQEIELDALRKVGVRAVGASFTGMLLGAAPLAYGFARALGLPSKACFAAAASLAPCSTGAALAVLRRKSAVNTLTGQAVVATAFAEDVIALILLSELGVIAAPSQPSAGQVLKPILISLAFAVFLLFAAVSLVPRFLSKVLLPRLAPHTVEPVLLGLLFFTAACLAAALSYAGASPLMGAFLAGLSFSNAPMGHVWHHQVKRVQAWLTRLFWASSVGFALPVESFGKGSVWRTAAVFYAATLGKLVAGLFAQPLRPPAALCLGAAMASLGEFSFIVGATATNELGLLSPDAYGAVTLAVLATIVISPQVLGRALDWQARIAAAAAAAARTPSARVYYKLAVRCAPIWGLTGALVSALASLNLTVLELRMDTDEAGMAVFEAYLLDEKLRSSDPAAVSFSGLSPRMLAVRTSLSMAIASHAGGQKGIAGGGVVGAAREPLPLDGGDEEAGAATPSSSSSTDDHALSAATIDFSGLKGVRLVRWMPGATPDAWATLGLEGNEESATTLMRSEHTQALAAAAAAAARGEPCPVPPMLTAGAAPAAPPAAQTLAPPTTAERLKEPQRRALASIFPPAAAGGAAGLPPGGGGAPSSSSAFGPPSPIIEGVPVGPSPPLPPSPSAAQPPSRGGRPQFPPPRAGAEGGEEEGESEACARMVEAAARAARARRSAEAAATAARGLTGFFRHHAARGLGAGGRRGRRDSVAEPGVELG